MIKSNGIDYVLVKPIAKEKQNRNELITEHISKECFIKNLNKYHIKDNQQKIIDKCIDNVNIEYCDTRQLNKTRFMIPIDKGTTMSVLLHKKLPTVVF